MSQPLHQRKGDGPPKIRMSLRKHREHVTEWRFRLHWDAHSDALVEGFPFDLDAMAFLLGSDDRLAEGNQENLVYYNGRRDPENRRRFVSPDGSTAHSGDSRTGDDDEIIAIRPDDIHPSVHSIVLAATIYNIDRPAYTFGMVNNVRVEIISVAGGIETPEVIYDVTHDTPDSTGVVFGRLLKTDDDWEFESQEKGYPGGLAEIGSLYDVEFSD
jgi:stress response protein SCP2